MLDFLLTAMLVLCVLGLYLALKYRVKATVFCETCREQATYHIEQEKMEFNGYNYLGLKAYCNQCGNMVYLAWINDFNLRKLNEVMGR